MSGTMEEAMRNWARGLLRVPDKNVCAAHLHDYAIRLFIKRNGQSGRCDYCGKSRITIDLEKLMNFLTDALMHFYKDPGEFMSYESAEGGYQGEVYDAWELLQGLGLDVHDEGLSDDIFNSLDLTNGWSAEYGNLADYRYENWLHFKNIVQHKSRFLFSSNQGFRIGRHKVSANDFLKELGSEVKRQKMLTTLPANAALYRCRPHATDKEITEAKHMCAPEEKFAIYPNRMSPAGVAMFYAAFDRKTAKLETVSNADKKNKFYTTAKFRSKKDLYLIDLTKFPQVSAFDQEKWDLYYIVSFLEHFMDDFTKTIERDGKEHIEYVPTQIITEYFRYEFGRKGAKKIDGIIYPSAKHRNNDACVLFMNHNTSLKKLKFIPGALVTRKLR